MQVKKPSRMRWTYESPERKVFVADGTRIYSYFPEDKQVIVSADAGRRPRRRRRPCSCPATAACHADFEASFAPEADPLPGTYSLKFVAAAAARPSTTG